MWLMHKINFMSSCLSVTFQTQGKKRAISVIPMFQFNKNLFEEPLLSKKTKRKFPLLKFEGDEEDSDNDDHNKFYYSVVDNGVDDVAGASTDQNDDDRFLPSPP